MYPPNDPPQQPPQPSGQWRSPPPPAPWNAPPAPSGVADNNVRIVLILVGASIAIVLLACGIYTLMGINQTNAEISPMLTTISSSISNSMNLIPTP